jgi:hypothetical protein
MSHGASSGNDLEMGSFVLCRGNETHNRESCPFCFVRLSPAVVPDAGAGAGAEC